MFPRDVFWGLEEEARLFIRLSVRFGGRGHIFFGRVEMGVMGMFSLSQ